LTRDAYALDLRQFVRWCTEHNVALFAVRRADIECFGRELEAKGKARATVARRLTTTAGFYRYAEEEGLIAVSPGAHVRRPRVDMESHAVGLDRNEVGGMPVVAGLGHPRDHALISLLALNGLRISEALGLEHRGHGHRTGPPDAAGAAQGRQDRPHPLAPRTARAVDLAVSERVEGPIFLAASGNCLDRHGAARIVRRVARLAAITKRVTPTPSVTPSLPPLSTPACPCVTFRRRPAMPIRGPRCAMTALECRWIETRRTSSLRSWPGPPGSS
jgi:site-specific recombinase XerD